MGTIHYKEGNFEKALEAFEAVKAVNPDFSDIDEILSLFKY